MEIEIDTRKNAMQNAAHYYEIAKKYKEKAAKTERAIEETKKKISAGLVVEKKKARTKQIREKKWFEKFHWFRTSDGFLVIAGRDAKQNELIVAKYLEKEDLFLHADVHGAPATVIKSDGKEISETAKKEAAQFAGIFSSAWKAGHTVVDVYAVKQEQVSKYSQGEYVAKGGFMISGEREWFKGLPLRLTLCVEDDLLVAKPPLSGIKGIYIEPGDLEKGELAENIKRLLLKQAQREFGLDEIIQLLPSGNGKLALR